MKRWHVSRTERDKLLKSSKHKSSDDNLFKKPNPAKRVLSDGFAKALSQNENNRPPKNKIPKKEIG